MTSLATFNPTFVCLQTIVSCIVLLDLTMTPSCKMIYTVSSLLRWAATWQMRLNSKKSHILSISRQRNQSSPVYYLGTDVLSTVSFHTYLGITVSSDLKWHEHISNICLKATRTLNFVRRNTYSCSQKAKNIAYLSLVCPNLEYAAAAWDPYMAKDIQQLERVQRRAACFVKKKIIVIQLPSLVCSTNLVGCPCSNVANTLV